MSPSFSWDWLHDPEKDKRFQIIDGWMVMVRFSLDKGLPLLQCYIGWAVISTGTGHEVLLGSALQQPFLEYCLEFLPADF